MKSRSNVRGRDTSSTLILLRPPAPPDAAVRRATSVGADLRTLAALDRMASRMWRAGAVGGNIVLVFVSADTFSTATTTTTSSFWGRTAARRSNGRREGGERRASRIYGPAAPPPRAIVPGARPRHPPLPTDCSHEGVVLLLLDDQPACIRFVSTGLLPGKNRSREEIDPSRSVCRTIWAGQPAKEQEAGRVVGPGKPGWRQGGRGWRSSRLRCKGKGNKVNGTGHGRALRRRP